METDALPTVIESGSEKEEERGLDFLPEDTIITLVLSLRLSLFTAIQVLMSQRHLCMERRRSGI